MVKEKNREEMEISTFYARVFITDWLCRAFYGAGVCLIDRPVGEKMTFHGEIYSLPERADIRKVVLLGSGKIRNIEIHARDKRNQWNRSRKFQAESNSRLKSH